MNGVIAEMKSTQARNDSTLFGSIREFFFAEQAPYGIALVRMFLPAARSGADDSAIRASS